LSGFATPVANFYQVILDTVDIGLLRMALLRIIEDNEETQPVQRRAEELDSYLRYIQREGWS